MARWSGDGGFVVSGLSASTSGAARASRRARRWPGGRPAASARRPARRAVRRARWPRRPARGPPPPARRGLRSRAPTGSGRPLSSAASSAGWRTESSLAQASTDSGKSGEVITPVRRQWASKPSGSGTSGTEVGRRAQAGDAGDALVLGGQVQRQHAAEAEADDEARLGSRESPRRPGRSGPPASRRREVPARIAGAAQGAGDDAPARSRARRSARAGKVSATSAAAPLGRGRS